MEAEVLVGIEVTVADDHGPVRIVNHEVDHTAVGDQKGGHIVAHDHNHDLEVVKINF